MLKTLSLNMLSSLAACLSLPRRSCTAADASYEGDLFSRAGVSYIVGRESNSTFNESLAGRGIGQGNQFSLPVDPFDAATGELLPLLSPPDRCGEKKENKSPPPQLVGNKNADFYPDRLRTDAWQTVGFIARTGRR